MRATGIASRSEVQAESLNKDNFVLAFISGVTSSQWRSLEENLGRARLKENTTNCKVEERISNHSCYQTANKELVKRNEYLSTEIGARFGS
jgi:hypothetical protein